MAPRDRSWEAVPTVSDSALPDTKNLQYLHHRYVFYYLLNTTVQQAGRHPHAIGNVAKQKS